jgi:hypothetical protein
MYGLISKTNCLDTDAKVEQLSKTGVEKWCRGECLQMSHLQIAPSALFLQQHDDDLYAILQA